MTEPIGEVGMLAAVEIEAGPAGDAVYVWMLRVDAAVDNRDADPAAGVGPAKAGHYDSVASAFRRTS